MFNPVDQIKSKIDIVEFISGYLTLKKVGGNYRSLCPFHKEKTPSFYVSPERQIWHCFGCNLGGDAIKFLMQMENYNFYEALEVLAKKLGLEIKKIDKALLSQKKEVLDALLLSAKFFIKNLFDKKNLNVLDYLVKERGLKKDTILKFKIGYSPSSFDQLKNFLISRGFSQGVLIASGLAIKNEQGKLFDRFRNRIMFPIFDLQDNVIGFSGRIFEPREKKEKIEELSKYVNSPNTIVYNKSQAIYLINFAKNKIKEKNSAIIVEGNMDGVLSQQAGVENAVASSGSSLTIEHLKIIRRYTDKINFAFDNDEAGYSALKKSIIEALSLGFEVYVIDYPEKDPGALIQKNPLLWQKATQSPKLWLDELIKKTQKLFPPTSPHNKKLFAGEVLPYIKAIKNPIERGEWLKNLSQILKIDEVHLYEAIKEIKRKAIFDQAQELEKPKSLAFKDLLEEYILLLYLKYPKEINDSILGVEESLFDNQNFKSILSRIKKNIEEKNIFDFAPASGEQNESTSYLFIKKDFLNLNNSKTKEEFEKTLIKLKKEKTLNELKELETKILELDEKKQGSQLAEILNEVDKKLKSLAKII